MPFKIHKPTANQVLGMAKIMRKAFRGESLEELSHACNDRIRNDPDDAGALLDMATILQINQRPDLAMELQSQALQMEQHFSLFDNPRTPELRLLAIMSPGAAMANTPLEFLIESTNISMEMIYLGNDLPLPDYIPDHDLAFMSICESDDNQALLRDLQPIMERWPRPFINAPAHIADLSRDRIAPTLSQLPGVAVSNASRFNPEMLQSLCRENKQTFPCIIRPTDSHAGHGLSKANDAGELDEYLASHSSEEYFVAPFIDYRSPDGWFRKYRIVSIDGQPFASHMAISQRWMVHYLNADMVENSRNRGEEARFMAQFDHRFWPKHAAALQSIYERIGLDYYSIDCAETTDGKLLVFEIDSGAVVHDMDPIDLFPYKKPQMQKVFLAFHEFLYRRANITRVGKRVAA